MVPGTKSPLCVWKIKNCKMSLFSMKIQLEFLFCCSAWTLKKGGFVVLLLEYKIPRSCSGFRQLALNIHSLNSYKFR